MVAPTYFPKNITDSERSRLIKQDRLGVAIISLTMVMAITAMQGLLLRADSVEQGDNFVRYHFNTMSTAQEKPFAIERASFGSVTGHTLLIGVFGAIGILAATQRSKIIKEEAAQKPSIQ